VSAFVKGGSMMFRLSCGLRDGRNDSSMTAGFIFADIKTGMRMAESDGRDGSSALLRPGTAR